MTCFYEANSQDNYCKMLYKRKPLNFYRDWHREYPNRPPAHVYKEKIFHKEINGTDSVLENEIVYDKLGKPVVDICYPVISNEGPIIIDSFFYDNKGNLTDEHRSYLDCILGWRKANRYFEYDLADRLAVCEETGSNANTTYTIYDSANRIIKLRNFPNGQLSKKEVHFVGEAGRVDSMQVFWLGSWIYTTEYKYDSIKRQKEAYLRHGNKGKLRSRFYYNLDGTVHSLLITSLPNENGRRENDVESIVEYELPGTIRQCIFSVNGKARFIKVHHYEYY